ncbi:winged helix-turn-helix domain-containing protein [Serratia fonticola]|uniref:winged helix-turn-helix domain-containing protein n=1 Tax=Serratia fonticola TaxID=47917 RepID=UPI001646184F|nr:winged helix-turn-helix domain-containing protein [Serratia fonticola]MBC3219743.1 winged helix-turn-helix domain-containing protein [Serratia fonticola]
MKYIINLIIIFDPESRLLILKNNNQLAVGLSNPATRLLAELIKNNKIELHRDTLLKHVWEDYGFSPSSATLSNHISELRKAFEALGTSKDILLTVPRIGFKLDAEIHPETIPPQASIMAEKIEAPPCVNEIVAEANTAPCLAAANAKTPMRRINLSALSVILTLLTLLTVAAITAFITLTKEDEPRWVGVQDKCNIYSLDNNMQDSQQSEGARKMLVSEGIDCTQVDHDIYYTVARPANETLKVSFMAVCTRNNNMIFKNCDNYKIIE